MDKGRILIVDDQQEILDSLQAVLADEGHETILAREGQEALHIVQSDSPDVVFLDVWIPGIDGMQTLKAIKKIDPQCTVIMMSGHGTIETAVKAIKLGAGDYLEKPLNLEDVLHLVEKAISARTPSGAVATDASVVQRQIIGLSEKAAGLRRALANAVAEESSVWLAGDKGTGKEFAAGIIHAKSGKDRNSLIKVRCADLTRDTIDEELLGKDNGTAKARPGKIAQAAGGTLLLVRVDRLEKSLRPRLGEILRDHFERSSRAFQLPGGPARIISTSELPPDTLLRKTGFPQEFIDMLSTRIVRLPTLRERSEDIPLFVEHFLNEAVEEFERDIAGTDEEAMKRLLAYSWPGNVKELKILIEHVVMTAPGPLITVNDLLIPGEDDAAGSRKLSQSEPEPVSHATSGANDAGSAGEPRTVAGTATESTVGTPFRHQKTLRGRVVMYGQGLHSGNKTGLTLLPLPPSAGILFGHITSTETVPAIVHNVESTDYSTSLRSNGSLAKTIEHLMAVFHVYGLTNVLVKISGEVPIMDGSALEFCRLVESAEIMHQDELVEEIRITEPIELPLPPGSPKSMRIEPSDCLEIEYYLDYPPPVGKMHMVFPCSDPEYFKEQIAPARTFGFVKDMRMMDEMGLAGGGRLSNVVLLDDEKVINPPLRFSDEFVRHKILDIIGDFYLLGRPFIGKIIAKQTGHTENIAMIRLINEKLAIL
ncbi:MAG: UDP-3-O-acyl-N-acetylglucosamine deacetylase [Desulfomonilaceae bacterium]|nr:UDP-3-O-acyl-N-acetylglucosamine deacetylase [Desulfomonilaceae bacterium]